LPPFIAVLIKQYMTSLKNTSIFLISIFFAAAIPLQVLCHDWQKVSLAVDGDTFLLENGRSVRCLGINAPEISHRQKPGEPFGYEAKMFCQKIFFKENSKTGKRVRLEFENEKYDRYKRLLAYLFLEDGSFVNGEIVRRGYAFYLPGKNVPKYKDKLLASQRFAMKSGLGIWKFWRGKKEKVAANSKSKKFHTRSCPFQKTISKANRIGFKNPWDAFYAGYAPCKKCGGIGN